MSEIVLNVVGFGLMLLGIWIAAGEFPLDIPQPAAAGMILGGIGLATFYIDTILAGEISFDDDSGYERLRYRGCTARLYGLLFLFMGGLIVLAGLIEWFIPGSMLTWLKSPLGIGVGLVMVGFLLGARAGVSLLHLLTTTNERTTLGARLNVMPGYIVASIGLCVAAVLFVAGSVQLAVPGILERTAQTWIDETIGPWPTPFPLPGDEEDGVGR